MSVTETVSVTVDIEESQPLQVDAAVAECAVADTTEEAATTLDLEA